MTEAAAWGLIAVLSVGTFLVRFSSFPLAERLNQLPPRGQHALELLPAAVLAALIVPSVVTIEGSVVETLARAELLAGLVGAVVAWKTENMIATIAAGMAVLWAFEFLL